jgi:rRNA maturation endonuclease Nob1
VSPKDLEEERADEVPVHGMRCEDCGNAFTIHEGDDPVCPSCGSTSTNPAHEPFL